jgi:tetratricopeptide (TPR) repeat protein
MTGDEKTLPFQFQLGKILYWQLSLFCFFWIEYLSDERCFFIQNPYEIVKAERRDYDDHIDFLIDKKRFDEAIQAFEKPLNINEKPRRHTQQVIYKTKLKKIELVYFLKSVYRAYVQSLIDKNETEKAVELFARVYKTSQEWEEQVLAFIERRQLDVSGRL